MNKENFFNNYPIRKEDSNKFDNGRVLIIAGSKGMAGACIYNIIGASSVGASYIDVYLKEDIYQIVSTNQIHPVYHLDAYENDNFLKLNAYKKAKAICFGSGLNNLNNCEDYLKQLLKETSVPTIIDAYGLHLLADNPSLLKLNNHLILTPHLGEFSLLTGLSIEEIKKDKELIAHNYALNNNLKLILKGPNTLVINNDGTLYKNNSGNSILARAGSGDVLSGMLAGLNALYNDSFKACKDAVWLHGHLADEALKYYSKEVFDLNCYPFLANQFFLKKF